MAAASLGFRGQNRSHKSIMTEAVFTVKCSSCSSSGILGVNDGYKQQRQKNDAGKCLGLAVTSYSGSVCEEDLDNLAELLFPLDSYA